MRSEPGLIAGPREDCPSTQVRVTTNKGCGDSGGCIRYRVPHIFLTSADGSDETRFLDIPAAQPNWSPDGVVLSRFWVFSEFSQNCLVTYSA